MALIKVGNPNILVNMLSKRVRQLNSSGSISRPLIQDTTGLGAADIALREIVEDKMFFEAAITTELVAETAPKKRRKAA